MRMHGHDIGICGWSVRPKDTDDLIGIIRSLGLSHLQLAVGKLIHADAAAQHASLGKFRDAGIKLTATMLSFPGEDYATIAKIHETGGYLADSTWPERREMTVAASKLTGAIEVEFLSTHIGFVPAKGAAGYEMMLGRIRELAGILSRDRVMLLLETGQEKAVELRGFLEDLRVDNVGVNFDPANMIMYGAGDPIEAVGVLAKHIRHVHVKDATASSKPGVEWGEEVPFGTGQVGPARFLAALEKIGYAGPLVIEREAGDTRVEDVRAAIAALKM